MAVLIDAWKLFRDDFKAQQALKQKQLQFQKITSKNLDYPMIESIAKAAAALRPGFYTEIVIEGAVIRFGVNETARPAPRREGETF